MKGIAQESQIIASTLERLKAVDPLRVMNLRREVSERDRGWDGEVTIKTAGGAYHYLFLEVSWNSSLDRAMVFESLVTGLSLLVDGGSRAAWESVKELLAERDGYGAGFE